MPEYVKCCVCQGVLEITLNQTDLMVSGKNVRCHFCGNVLWIVINAVDEVLFLSSQLPFILLPGP